MENISNKKDLLQAIEDYLDACKEYTYSRWGNESDSYLTKLIADKRNLDVANLSREQKFGLITKIHSGDFYDQVCSLRTGLLNGEPSLVDHSAKIMANAKYLDFVGISHSANARLRKLDKLKMQIVTRLLKQHNPNHIH